MPAVKHEEALQHILSCARCRKAFYSAMAREAGRKGGRVVTPARIAAAKKANEARWGKRKEK
jgi:hypothetical protein